MNNCKFSKINIIPLTYFQKNIIATYLHGPLLSKDPELADYIIKYCLDRKYDENIMKFYNTKLMMWN